VVAGFVQVAVVLLVAEGLVVGHSIHSMLALQVLVGAVVVQLEQAVLVGLEQVVVLQEKPE
jgi:hypothetical protein